MIPAGAFVFTRLAGAVIRLSGPAVFCKSPIANISAIRALARATDIALVCPEDRSEMLESVNKPTAMTVNKIISDKVTISAKPLACGGLGRVFIDQI